MLKNSVGSVGVCVRELSLLPNDEIPNEIAVSFVTAFSDHGWPDEYEKQNF
jgi:hypothetical protein